MVLIIQFKNYLKISVHYFLGWYLHSPIIVGVRMRIIRFGLLFLILSLVIAPVSDAWSWDTHSVIIDVIYQGLPTERPVET